MKLTENHTVTPSRLFAQLTKACRTSYRNIRQPSSTDGDLTALASCKRRELRELAQCRLARSTNIAIARVEFEVNGCQWHGGEMRPQLDAPTCSAYDHSAQSAFEFLIKELELVEDPAVGALPFSNLAPITMSWVTSLVPGVKEQAALETRPPVVLKDTRSGKYSLVLASTAGR